MENIIIQKANDKCSYTKIYAKPTRFVSNIKIFGEIGIVCVYDMTIKAKLDDRGIHCMFIGYSKYHKDDVYCMLNMKTLKVKNT